MAIGSNDAIHKFGTKDEVTTASSNGVASGAFSVGDDLVSDSGWTNDDDAPQASVTIEAKYDVTPTANTTIDLFSRIMNAGGSSADPFTPDANFEHSYLGSFPLKGQGGAQCTATQVITITVDLPNDVTSQVHEFYIKNNGGQAIEPSWSLHVTPRTIGPGA